MARLVKNPVPGFPQFGSGMDFDTIIAEQKLVMAELEKVHQALPDGKWEGYLHYIPIADGYAVYRVVKSVPLTLQHVPWMDGYEAPAAHIRGLRLGDLEKQRAFFKKFMHKR